MLFWWTIHLEYVVNTVEVLHEWQVSTASFLDSSTMKETRCGSARRNERNLRRFCLSLQSENKLALLIHVLFNNCNETVYTLTKTASYVTIHCVTRLISLKYSCAN
jgi:hypothetical protein